jgi:hypothetical protein
VDQLAAEFGGEVRRLILSRDARLSRSAVARLVQAPQAERQAVVQELLTTKRSPKPKRGERSRTLVLPREPAKLPEALLRKVGPEQFRAIIARMQALLGEPAPGARQG